MISAIVVVIAPTYLDQALRSNKLFQLGQSINQTGARYYQISVYALKNKV